MDFVEEKRKEKKKKEEEQEQEEKKLSCFVIKPTSPPACLSHQLGFMQDASTKANVV